MSVAQKPRKLCGLGQVPQGSQRLTRPSLVFSFIFSGLQETAAIAANSFDNRSRGYGMAPPAEMIEF
jgi:hypothetical protein